MPASSSGEIWAASTHFTAVGLPMSFKALRMEEITKGLGRAGEKDLSWGTPTLKSQREELGKEIKKERLKIQQKTSQSKSWEPSEEIIGRRRE